MLAPSASRTIDIVVSIPVVDIFAPLAGEDTFICIIFTLAHIICPIVEHIIILLDASRVQVGSCHRTSFVGEFLLCNLQGLQGEILWITGLIENRFPHEDTSVVTVTTDDVARILMDHLAPFRVFVPILPTWSRYDDKKSQFVAGIHERRILWIVSSANNRHTSISQTLGITPLLGVWKGIADIGKILMTIAADKLMIRFAIQPETVFTSELRLTNTSSHHTAIYRTFAIQHLNLYTIQIRCLRRPEMGGIY